ncbi:MAG: GNAT family N-acetyltransferase [Gallionellaceae bacterium]|jgi:GNAT superfamily N-acetyltransferase
MSQKVKVRNTLVSDIKTLIALQKRVYPSIPAWREDMLHHQLTVFPQGQMVAEVDGQLVGAASSLVVLWDEWEVQHTWQDITSLGSFDTHNPAGRTLYAAEVFVNPEQRGSGIGHAIYQARRRLCRQLNLKRIIACGRLPGYHRYAAQMTAELYAQKVIWGDLRDPVLSFQLREGFNYCGTVSGYIPEDHESLGYAALIVWLNQRYNKKKPTLTTEGVTL